jgi:hypothetical protein
MINNLFYNIRNFFIAKFNNNISLIIFFFILSRIIYLYFFKIIFDISTVNYYWQFFPKNILNEDLFTSLFYNFYQPPLLNLIYGLLLKFTIYYSLYIQIIYLLSSVISFIFFYKILVELKFNNTFSCILTCLFMIWPTTLLYENHFYKEHLVMFFLTLSVFFSIKIIKYPHINVNYFFFSLFIILLSLTRETFNIVWIYFFFLFLLIITKQYKKIILFFLFVNLFVLPFYLKNYFLYNNFSINLAPWENLSQKIEFVKEMKDPNRHKLIKSYFFKNTESFDKLENTMSVIYNVRLNSGPNEYNKYLHYKYKYNHPLLKSDSFFNEIYLEVEEARKNDFLKVFKNYPGLIFISFSNAFVRHFFRSSDTFAFVKNNADKMPFLIKISHCVKLTLACVFEFDLDTKVANDPNYSAYLDKNFDKSQYLYKVKSSLNDINFILIFLYIALFFYFFKNLLHKKNQRIDYLINFWFVSFLFIFFILIVFEDGEIPRHRYPFDYLSFLFFLYFKKNSKKKT